MMLLGLVGCSKKDPLHLGVNAIVVEVNKDTGSIIARDPDEMNSTLFGEGCSINCSKAQIIYCKFGTKDLKEISLGDLQAGDEITIDLRESEVKSAKNGSCSAEKIQLITQRLK